MTSKNGIVHLQDLPEDKICISLPSKIQKEMITTALKFAKNRRQLALKINVNPGNIHDFELSRFESISLSFIKKLSEFLYSKGYNKYSLQNLEKQLKLIKAKFVGVSIIRPKFPINFNSEEGSQIISSIFFDGGITAKCLPIYVNSEEILVDKFLQNIHRVIGKFEISGNIKKKDYFENVFRITLPKAIGLILVDGLNIPAGDKTFNNPSIPEFILKNSHFYKCFLQQAFDDEGNVVLSKEDGSGRAIRLYQSNYENNPSKRLLQLKKLIENFKINVSGPCFSKKYKTASGNFTYHWYIQITNQTDIKNFAEKINFSLNIKKQKLHKLIHSYISKPQFKKGTKLKELYKACRELKKENSAINIRNIALKLNRQEYYVKRLMEEYMMGHE